MKTILANLVPIRRYGCKSIGMNNLGTLSFAMAQQQSPGGATS